MGGMKVKRARDGPKHHPRRRCLEVVLFFPVVCESKRRANGEQKDVNERLVKCMTGEKKKDQKTKKAGRSTRKGKSGEALVEQDEGRLGRHGRPLGLPDGCWLGSPTRGQETNRERRAKRGSSLGRGVPCKVPRGTCHSTWA